MSRDLRATLREFLTMTYGLTYDQCVEISEGFCDFLVKMGDSEITVRSTVNYQELYYRLVGEYSPKSK